MKLPVFCWLFLFVTTLCCDHAVAGSSAGANMPVTGFSAAVSAKQLSSPVAAPQITQAIIESSRVPLTGSTPRQALAASDQGAVASDFPMRHMFLQLKRSPEREQALQMLMDELHTAGSPHYQQWLTAEEFGALYGPAQEDIARVTNWLASYGFTVNTVYSSGMVVDFSGTAGQVQQAFATSIHRYLEDGKTHTANTSDPSIPTALVPVVAGIVALNDFRPQPSFRATKKRSAATGVMKRTDALTNPNPNPDFTYIDNGNEAWYYVTPADFAKIYHVEGAWSGGNQGQGQTIVMLEKSDMFEEDWNTFKTTFDTTPSQGAISHLHPQPKTGAPNCVDPGVVFPNHIGVSVGAEWAHATAPEAKIVVASCQSGPDGDGLLIAGQNLINSSDPPAILTVNYGFCEKADGAAPLNTAFSNLWQQAAAEGTTVIVPSGNNGAAACDPDPDNPYQPVPDTNYNYIAEDGIAVNGLASTPYNVAVGGTDFYDSAKKASNLYWNSSPTTMSPYGSALSYIPEIPWNSTCASSINSFGVASDPMTYCNQSLNQLVGLKASGGGPSNVNFQPVWQTGVYGIPHCTGWFCVFTPRKLPDISLFAADGINPSGGSLWPNGNHALVLCATGFADENGKPVTCDYSQPSMLYYQNGGNTSFAASAFAGIQALINQATGVRQGNSNYLLYSLAAKEYGGETTPNSSTTSASLATCDSSNKGKQIGGDCIFQDITKGDIDVPCDLYFGSPNCNGGNPLCNGNNGPDSFCYGLLSTTTYPSVPVRPAFIAQQGWDNATGLGSINVANLVNAVQGPATHLVFSQQPTPTTVGNTVVPAISVTLRNAAEAVVDNGTTTIDLTVLSGCGTLSGGMSVPTQAGVATFNNVSLSAAGPCTLKATATLGNQTPAISANSTPFNVVAPTATQIVFQQPPTDSKFGVALTPAVEVALEDAQDMVQVGDNLSSVTLTVATGPGVINNAGGGPIKVNAGVASFSGLTFSKSGTYTLTATSGNLAVTSGSFVVSGHATQLVFTQQPPSTMTVGVGLSPTISVSVEDSSGNLDTTVQNSPVTLKLDACGGLTLGTANTTNGIAVFNNVPLRFYTVTSIPLQFLAEGDPMLQLKPAKSNISVQSNTDVKFISGFESCVP